LTGKKTWKEVTTDANGFNDNVYITALAQVCKLNWGESPFFGNWGIAAHASIILQIAPDFYINRIQQQFAKYFSSLIVMRNPDAVDERGRPTPNYTFNIITNSGAQLLVVVPF
jgi:hypothetical protein